MSTKCLNCNHQIFHVAPQGINGPPAISTDDPEILQNENGRYVICPECGKKNEIATNENTSPPFSYISKLLD
jgi:DNA-directed RNA polymerase subunit RPC12/RpoP